MRYSEPTFSILEDERNKNHLADDFIVSCIENVIQLMKSKPMSPTNSMQSYPSQQLHVQS